MTCSYGLTRARCIIQKPKRYYETLLCKRQCSFRKPYKSISYVIRAYGFDPRQRTKRIFASRGAYRLLASDYFAIPGPQVFSPEMRAPLFASTIR